VTPKEKSVLEDSLQKQEEGRDWRGRFLKGRSGNPEGGFRKGQSGNPAGRRPGSRNKATETAELLLAGEVEALTRKAVELALGGDAAALRLCLDRIIPARRGRPVQLAVAPVRGTADLGYREGQFPVTERKAKQVFSLPMYPQLKDEEVDTVVATLKEVIAGSAMTCCDGVPEPTL